MQDDQQLMQEHQEFRVLRLSDKFKKQRNMSVFSDLTTQTTSHKRGTLLAGARLNNGHTRPQRVRGVEAHCEASRDCEGFLWRDKRLLDSACHIFSAAVRDLSTQSGK